MDDTSLPTWTAPTYEAMRRLIISQSPGRFKYDLSSLQRATWNMEATSPSDRRRFDTNRRHSPIQPSPPPLDARDAYKQKQLLAYEFDLAVPRDLAPVGESSPPSSGIERVEVVKWQDSESISTLRREPDGQGVGLARFGVHYFQSGLEWVEAKPERYEAVRARLVMELTWYDERGKRHIRTQRLALVDLLNGGRLERKGVVWFHEIPLDPRKRLEALPFSAMTRASLDLAMQTALVPRKNSDDALADRVGLSPSVPGNVVSIVTNGKEVRVEGL